MDGNSNKKERMNYRFEAFVEFFEYNVWGHHVMVPEQICQTLTQDGQRRMRCSVNNSDEFPCALMPIRGEGVILLNQSLRKSLGIREGQLVQVRLVKDESEYGMPMPEEMMTTFELDPKAHEFFNKLSMGKRRSLIYLVLKVKSSQIRINKSLAIAHHLCTQHGAINYKQLQEDFRLFAK
jgi:hypothetical protein